MNDDGQEDAVDDDHDDRCNDDDCNAYANEYGFLHTMMMMRAIMIMMMPTHMMMRP